MMRKLVTRLFQRRCPICRTEVQSGSGGAVRCFGKWCCSQSHADAYECSLYEALDEFNVAMLPATGCTYRYAWLHAWTLPSLAPPGWDKGSRAAVAHGSPHATSLVACNTWEGRTRIVDLNDVKGIRATTP